MQENKNQNVNPSREGGDEALSNLEQSRQGNIPNEQAGYSNEERVSEDEEGINMPEKRGDAPAGTGIPTKE